ncbi:MAG: hypothetical protein CFE21_05320 [Bacteroidetes bacterium B1(2017)]|nr:MAG: hypothetical protein CFE21_05320 [Bacteroidetes bacterium B1(2017)]
MLEKSYACNLQENQGCQKIVIIIKGDNCQPEFLNTSPYFASQLHHIEMKKILLIISVFLIKISVFGQTADSVTMLPGTALDVYYNLTTGHKDTVRNNNWHIAFAVRKAQPPMKTMQAATILVNDGRSVELYKSNTLISDWNTFDTTGWNKWPHTYNSDTSWDVGAFNQDRNMTNPFDYGWGQYNMTTKDVTGTNIWVVAITTSPDPSAPKTLKKLAIHRIAYDTMWVFTFSNINGTDSTTLTIKKSDFGNKLFAYVNLLSKTVIDREPALNTWDVVFTRYKSLVTLFGQTLMYPVMGVMQNPTVVSAKVEQPNARTFTPDTTLKLTPKISQIGWDWKVITVTPGAWPVRDSLSYILKKGDNQYYKIYFTEYYADQTKQFIKFNTTFYSMLTGTDEISTSLKSTKVYPNPATDKVNLDLNLSVSVNNLTISLIDITGRVISTENLKNVAGSVSHEVNVSQLHSGIYFISVEADGVRTAQKIVIN